MTGTWARSRWWLAPLAAGLLLRLALLPVAARMAAAETPGPSLAAARAWRTSATLPPGPDGLTAPLHPVAVAWALDTSAGDADAFPGVPLVQIAADAVALVLLGGAAARRFGRRAGSATAWLYALHPSAALAAGAMVAPTSITTAALALAAVALAGIDRKRGGPWVTALALGVGLGLTMLADEAGLTVTVAVTAALLLWAPGSPPRRIGLAAVVLGIALATTTPWAEHTRGMVGTALLSGTRGDHARVVDNAPPGVAGELLWDAEPDLAARHALARRLRLRALTEWPALTAERAARRLRVLLGPDTSLPARLGRVFDGPDGRARGPGALRLSWRLPPGSLGRVTQLLCGLAVLLVFSLGAAGRAAAPGDLYGRTVLLVTVALVLRGLLGVGDDGLRSVLAPLWLPMAGWALDLATQAAPSGERSVRRAAAVGLGAAALLTLTLFLLPAP